MDKKLIGKVAFVTGASSGIGKAVAILFAKEGANVIISSYKNMDGGEATIAEMRKINPDGEFLHINCNLGKVNEVKDAFSMIAEKFGHLDILINNAGTAPSYKLLEISEENFDSLFASNVKSVLWCTQEATKLMKDRGWIINTSSIRGLDYAGRSISYAATKAAVNSLTKTIAQELAPNIFVNAVLPGFVWTPNYDKNPTELNQKFINGCPLKRFITCDEIASSYLFLATQEYLTGTLLVADGGSTILGR